MARKRHFKGRHFAAKQFAAGQFGPFGVAAADIVGAGGIGTGEAFGQPTITTVPVEEVAAPSVGGSWTYIFIPPTEDHQIGGAGGIQSAEAVGRPVITPGRWARSRQFREEEWILRRAA